MTIDPVLVGVDVGLVACRGEGGDPLGVPLARILRDGDLEDGLSARGSVKERLVEQCPCLALRSL